MAIIEAGLSTSGWNVYAIIRNSTAQVWNGSAFEAFTSGNWTTYAISLTEQTGTFYYQVTFPTLIAAGRYSFMIHRRMGAAAAIGDPLIDQGLIDTTDVSTGVASIVAKLPSGSISGFDPTAQNVNLSTNQSGVTIGTVNALGTSAAASVKTQIDTSVGTDTISELTGVPSSTPTLKAAIMFLYMALRNKRTTTATTVKIYNASGTSITSATRSDDGTTGTKDVFS